MTKSDIKYIQDFLLDLEDKMSLGVFGKDNHPFVDEDKVINILKILKGLEND